MLYNTKNDREEIAHNSLHTVQIRVQQFQFCVVLNIRMN